MSEHALHQTYCHDSVCVSMQMELQAGWSNPIAWDKGLVFVQCGQCKAWHQIQDAAGLIEEIRYSDEDKGDSPDSPTDGQ